uniref:site-specific DNA-methyltransferase (adenine-specific) n=1 Tax=uncultured bacterium contig00013 TaxID=1181504 RepID=A0A806KJG8_9BACT|nr:putative type IIS restriction/modification enzyme [uncultured bacterium contig00013]
MTEYIMQHGNSLSFPDNGQSWVILSDIEKAIKEKIEKIGKPLRDWDINIYRGILTGCNEAFIIDKEKRDELIKKDAKSAEIIRPILRGRDIGRYQANFSNLYLINTHNGIISKNIPPIEIKDYPAIKKHLDKYWTKINNRDDQGLTPYNLRSCAYMEDFSKQKILWAETMRIHKSDIMNFPRFGFTETDYFTDKTCFFATGNHLYYILAYLNSSIGRYLCKRYVSILDNGGYLMQKVYLEPIPIIKPTDVVIKEIEIISKKIIEKQRNEYENIINQKIFTLYDFRQEEINYITKDNYEPLSNRKN